MRLSVAFLLVSLVSGFCLIQADSTQVDGLEADALWQELSEVVQRYSSKDQDVENVNTDTVSVSIDLTHSQHATDSKFLSVTIDSGFIEQKFRGFDFQSDELRMIARALSPCILRLGGTAADFLIFDPKGQGSGTEKRHGQGKPSCAKDGTKSDGNLGRSNYTMSGSLWENISQFTRDVGWDILFDFNVFLRKDGRWDPDNAKSFLDFSDALDIDILEFQLGNEPNAFVRSFNISITPQMLAKDVQTLKDLISNYPRYKKSPLCGPDVTDLGSGGRAYVDGFLQGGAYDTVSEISAHHYYENGATAGIEDFTNVHVFEKLRKAIETGQNITRHYPNSLPLRFTETSSCYHGGAKGLSDAYVAGFLWLDKLGMAATYGVTKVFRQTFYGGSYALIDDNKQPLPDFYLSVLHKRLVLGPVFNVTLKPANPKLRIYAQCTRIDPRIDNYVNGTVTLSYLNVDTVKHTLSLSQFPNEYSFVYSLTPGDSDGLKSKYVALNGEVLKIDKGHLPVLDPATIKGDITVPAMSFGFIVLPYAKASLCEKHFSSAP